MNNAANTPETYHVDFVVVRDPYGYTIDPLGGYRLKSKRQVLTLIETAIEDLGVDTHTITWKTA